MNPAVLYKLLIVTCFIMALSPAPVQAQKRKSPDFIFIAADGKDDFIHLRWAPSSPFLWQLGNRYGYTLVKYLVSKEGNLLHKLPVQESPGLAPVQPASPDLMKALAAKDSMVEVMASLIYDNNKTNTAGPEGILNQSSMLYQRYGYALLISDLDYNAALAAGLAFTDKHVQKGERYIYKITLNLPDPLKKEVSYKEGTVFSSPAEHWRKPAVGLPDMEVADNYVTLHWNIEHLAGFYTAYEIERSGDGIHYSPATDLPFVQMAKDKSPSRATFTDSVYQPNTDSIYYRVRGITPFGERSAFSPAAAQRNFIVPAYRPHIDSIQRAGGALVRVCWRLPDSIARKTEGLYLFVANKAEGPYLPVTKSLLSPRDSGYTDTVHYVSNYYKLSVVYAEQHKTFSSLPYLYMGEDSVAPARPVIVRAMTDPKGRVTLRWKANTENDLLGYRVFRANGLSEEFTEITRHPYTDTVWHDSLNLNTLTSHVYYTMLAVDKYYNASRYSDTIVLRRPDTIAPAPAIIARAGLQGDTVLLTIIPTRSADLMQYSLHRIDVLKPKDTIWLAGLQPSRQDSLFYKDASAIVGNTYQYLLFTYDSSNNRSVNRSGLVVCEPGYRKAVDWVSAMADREKKQVQLNWGYPLAGVEKYIIYRSKADGVFTTLCTAAGSNRNYTDKQVNINNTYKYKITAVFGNGRHSLMSMVKEVVY